MAPEPTLRPAGTADAGAVAELHLRSRAAAVVRGAMPPGVHSDAEVRAWLVGRLEHDEVWVAETGGELLGYARFTETWLDDLYVAPEAMRAGVGSALLGVVRARRPDGFCLWVFESNRPARAFYACHGLVELERTDGTANEERAPDLRMAWPGEQPLRFLRSLVDDVDHQLGDLLARRAALTAAIQPLKASRERDPAREREVAETLAARAPALGVDRLERLVHVLVTESLDAARPSGE